ncbi:MAG: hypothetical protein EBT44_03225 [Actinobacteria bacterium]|uniref:Uncharacterized protein n=1 Tax=Candidatus Fonsibacter lacus TaxID=2576439 RepID=A0A965GD21_9PROT|nr:hypothetical protein [Candidatus Fonsibacter lacus]
MERSRATFERANREFAHSAPEPTLDELRSDLSRAIGDFANQNFADKYGPLVGSVAENTAEKILREFESNGVKARKEAEFVAKELVDRIIRGLSK